MPSTIANPAGVRPATRTTTTIPRRSIQMHAQADLRLFLARGHREADLRAAADERRLREARSGRRGARARIGQSFIRLGERLVSEPPLEPTGPG